METNLSINDSVHFSLAPGSTELGSLLQKVPVHCDMDVHALGGLQSGLIIDKILWAKRISTTASSIDTALARRGNEI